MPQIFFFLAAGIWLACVAEGNARTRDEIATVFDSGVRAFDGRDYAKAYALWTSIEDEDIAAMRNVAILLRKGLGVPKNPKKAEEIFKWAADAGLVTAQADLADMLLRGEAGPPDPKRALPLLRAAAAGNHPIAQYELAQIYEAGDLIPKDIEEARRLYSAAAGHGLKKAADRLAALPPSVRDFIASASATTLAPGLQVAMNIAPTVPTIAGAKAAPQTYVLQIGAFPSQSEATTRWHAYQSNYPTLLLDYSPDVQYANLGEKGIWYRLRIAGLGHRKATDLCNQLKAAGADCLLYRNTN